MTTENKRSSIDDIRHNLGLMADQFKKLFPTQQHVDRFVRVVMTAVQQNPDLLDPSIRVSFYSACMRCAQDGLMPDGREAALVYYGGKNPSVNYQPMVEGMFKKLRNSGEIVGAPKVHVWKQGDIFDYQLGDDERIVHKPGLKDRGPTLGAYSIVKLKSGDTSREVMTIDEIERIRSRSRSSSGPWSTDFDEMARKTVFRRHYKKLPKSSDLDNVLSADDDTFVPFENSQATAALPSPQNGSGATHAQAKRPAALEAVAQHGGTPMPTQTVQREPVTVEHGAAQEQQAGAGGPPKDVL